MASKKRILLGKIATAHGVKGLVKLHVYAEDKTLLKRPLYTQESGARTLALTLKNSLGKYWLAAIDGVTDRTHAEALRGTELWIDRDALPTLDTSEIYYEDMIGLAVAEENGTTVGTVIGVDDFGAGPLLDIEPTGGGENFYLPFADQYVLKTDLDSGTLIATIPDGLR